MQIRDILPLPVRPCLLLALLAAALGPASVQAQQYPPPVVALQRALYDLLPPPDSEEFPKALQERAKTLKRLTDDNSQLQNLSDIAQALLLEKWDEGLSAITGPERGKVDRDAREALLQRYLRGVRSEIKAGEEARDPILRAAVATQIAEFSALALNGFLAREINRQLMDAMPRFTAVLAELAERDRSPQVRAVAAGALARLQCDPTKENSPRNDEFQAPLPLELTVPALRTLLKDPNVEVRRAGAAALSDLVILSRPGDRRVIPSSRALDELLRRNLDNFGPQVASAAGAVLAGDESDAEVRRLAAAALLQVGTLLNSKLQLEVPLLRARELRVQLRPIVDVLLKQASALSRAARDPDPEVRYAALRALEELGDVRRYWIRPPEPQTPSTSEPPSKFVPSSGLGATAEDLSGIALAYAVALAPPVPARNEPAPLVDTIPALVAALNDDDVRNRRAAVDALEAITASTSEQTVAQDIGKEPAATVAKALTRTLSDRDRFVRWAAARTLGKMAPLDDAENGKNVERGAVAGLARLLSDSDPDVRLRVAIALRNFGKAAQEAVPALAVAASRGDVAARIASARAIEEIGGSPAEAVPALAAGLTDPNVRLRRAVAQALASYGADARAAKPALSRALSDPDPDVRHLASDALLRIGTRR